MGNQLSAYVRLCEGKPVLIINERPVLPVLYSLTAIPGGRWSWEEIPNWNIKQFGNAGIHLHQVDLALNDVWLEDGSIDLSVALHQIQGVLDADPQAGVMLRFHVNAPRWWELAHPDECIEYADTDACVPEPITTVYTVLSCNLDQKKVHSLASVLWKKEAGEAYAKFLQKLEATEQGDRVFSIQVADGVYGEWHYFGFIEHDPDIGQPMLREFRRFLQEKYGTAEKLSAAWDDPEVDFENASLPNSTARKYTSDGIFRAYAKEQRVIDCYECLHNTVAEAILHFCRITKETWSRPIVTASFYGYLYRVFGRHAAGGHLNMEKILASEAIDCICAPQSYFVEHRAMGGSGQSRMLQEPARLHGKLALDEMDQPTFLDRMVPDERDLANITLEDSVMILRRNLFSPISRGMGMWYFDFGPNYNTGMWNHPVLLREIQEMNVLIASRYEQPYVPAADVLLVYDAHSFLYTANNPADDTLTENITLNQVSAAVYHAGVCFDAIYLFDLEQVDIARYRTVVFVNTYVIDERQQAFIKEKVANGGRHLLWFYAPGGVSSQGADAVRISQLTGIHVSRLDGVNPLVLSWKSGTLETLDLEKRSLTLSRLYGSLYNDRPKLFSPIFEVTDKDSETIGCYAGTQHAALAKKRFDNWVSWYAAIPTPAPDLLREIFRESGAHIYNEAPDTLLIGMGMIMIHTKDGGAREITLRSGKKIALNIPPRYSILIDAETGETLRG